MNTQIIHIARNGEEVGAWPANLIADMTKSGSVRPTDHWWVEGMSDWQPMAALHTPPPAADTSPNAAKKNPGIAAVLSLIVPGAGHLYVGHYAAGILFVLCFAAIAVVMMTLDQLRSGNAWIVGLLAVAFVLYAIIDSIRKAK
jgi:TM2 domain-containing membrane protein YozV